MPKIPCSSLAVNLSWSAKAVQGDAVSASGCVRAVARARGEWYRPQSTEAPPAKLLAERRLSAKGSLARAHGLTHVLESAQARTSRSPAAAGHSELPQPLGGLWAAGGPREEGDAPGLRLERVTPPAQAAPGCPRHLLSCRLVSAKRMAIPAGGLERIALLAAPVGGRGPGIAEQFGRQGDAALVSLATTHPPAAVARHIQIDKAPKALGRRSCGIGEANIKGMRRSMVRVSSASAVAESLGGRPPLLLQSCISVKDLALRVLNTCSPASASWLKGGRAAVVIAAEGRYKAVGAADFPLVEKCNQGSLFMSRASKVLFERIGKVGSAVWYLIGRSLVFLLTDGFDGLNPGPSPSRSGGVGC
jgi:hypothetical protein